MKKIALFLLALIGLLSYSVAKGKEAKEANNPCFKEFEIVMDRDGQIEKICWNGRNIYQRLKPSSIIVDPFNVRVLEPKSDLPRELRAGLSVGTRVKITIDGIGKKDKFNITVIPQQTKYELIPIFTGKTELPSSTGGAATLLAPAGATASPCCFFFLDKKGTTYQIEVTRLTGGKAPTPAASGSNNNDERGATDQVEINHINNEQASRSAASGSEKYSKNNIVSINDSASADQTAPTEKVIFAENLQTAARYNFGSHIGVFVPLRRSAQYNLAYADPVRDPDHYLNDAEITENNSLKATMVFIASYYPFGFEPEAKFFSYGRIQLNLGAELSSSIFKRIYFGPGYNFPWFSINVLFRYGETQELQNGFHKDDIITDGILNAIPLPTVSKNKIDWGVTLCLPADFLIGWLGKSLGLK